MNDDVRRAAVESLGFILFRYSIFLGHFYSLEFDVHYIFRKCVCCCFHKITQLLTEWMLKSQKIERE